MGAEGQTALALAHPGDQQADHGEHRPGGTPCGLLPPYGGARRRGLAPAQARCHGGGLLLRGLEPRGLRPDRRPDRRGPHCPPVVCVGRGQGRDRDHEAIACRRRGGGRLGGASPPRPPRRAAATRGLTIGPKAAASRRPTRRGRSPAPLPPRLRSPCGRSSRPSFRCPEAGRGSPRRVWGVRLRPSERHGRGILGPPGRRHGRDRERCERDGAPHLLAIGGTQGIAAMPQAGIMECGPREPWLQPRSHSALGHPLPPPSRGPEGRPASPGPRLRPHAPTRAHARDEAG